MHALRLHRLGTIALASIALACPSAPRERRWVACTCDYVTDFDQPGHIAVEVCSGDIAPVSAAENCGRGAGVGAITSCRCGAGAASCEPSDACRMPGAR